MKIFCLLLLLAVFADAKNKRKSKNPPAKIAIVGGGVGGSSAAYFLREKFGSNVQIDLYEKDELLCGRVASVDVGGVEYETGAVLMFQNNMHLQSFRKKFGFEALSRFSGQPLAIFDGEDYVLRSSSHWLVSFFRKIWTFGMSSFKMKWHVDEFLTKLEKIYDLQSKDECFEDVKSLVHALGGDELVRDTQRTAHESFYKAGVSWYMVHNLVSPVLRTFYGQNANANGFVGAVAMAAIQPGLWSIKGGNKQVCYKLVEHSSTNVLHEEVVRVSFDENAKNEKFSVFTKQSPTEARRYDIVIVAAPIGSDMSHIDLSEACSEENKCPSAKTNPLKYRRFISNFVKGRLNSTLFQCNSWRECPNIIVVPNEDTFYQSVALTIPVDFDPVKGHLDPVYAAFTPEPMTDEQKDYLFESHSDTVSVDWMAFPQYNPPDKLNSFVLNEAGLYYTSPIEWAASFMEMSIISGKNSALLAYKNWYSIPKRRFGGKGGKTEL